MKKVLSMFIMVFAISSMMMAQQLERRTAPRVNVERDHRHVAPLPGTGLNVAPLQHVENVDARTQRVGYCARTAAYAELQAERAKQQAQTQAEQRPQRLQSRAFATYFSHSFEGTLGSDIPDGWARVGGEILWAVSPGAWATAASFTNFWGLTAGPPRTGTRQAVSFVAGITEANNAWLFTPAINVVAGVTYEISFWYRIPAAYYNGELIPANSLRVTIGTGQSEAQMNVAEPLFTINTHAQNWTLAHTSWTATETGPIYLGFNDFSPVASPHNGFLLLIDDVFVGRPRENDLAVTGVGPRPASIPARIPIHQMAGRPTFPISPSATVQNIGTAPQTNVTMSAEFGGNSVGVFTTHPTLAPGESHTFESTSVDVALPTTLGEHRITFTAGQAETDDDPLDNVMTGPVFTVTRDIYRHDELEGGNLVNLFSPSVNNYYGHIFTISEPTVTDRFTISVRNQVVDFWSVVVSIFRLNDDGSVPNEPVFSMPWTFEPNAQGSFFPALSQPIALHPGRYFLAMRPMTTATGNRDFITDQSQRGTMVREGNATNLTQRAGGAIVLGLFLPEETTDIQTPTSLTTTNVTNTTATVVWTTSGNYRLTVFNTATGEHVSGTTGGGWPGQPRIATLTGLTINTEYTIRVFNTGGPSSEVAWITSQRSPWLEHTFTTENRVMITESSPAPGEENIALDADIVLTFNKDITFLSYAGITFEPANVTGISATAVGNVLTITHDGLTGGVMYRITIPETAIQDDFRGETWTFTTVFPVPDFPDPFDVAVAVVADRATLTWNHFGSLPLFTEGFETTMDAGLPPGWSPEGTEFSVWRSAAAIGAIGGDPHSGERQLLSNWDVGQSGWVFSSGIELVGGTAYQISFWYQAPGYDDEPDNFRVRIGTGQSYDAMVATVFEQITTVETGVYAWTRVTYAFTPATTGTFHLGFERIHPGLTGNRIQIDEIAIVPLEGVADGFNIFLNDMTTPVANATDLYHTLTGLTTGEHIAGVQAVGSGDVSNIKPILFTIAPPVVATRTPAINAMEVDVEAPITVTFDHATVIAGDLTGITIYPVLSFSATVENGNVLTITHGGFEFGTVYTVTIPVGTIAEFEHALEWSFRTVPNCNATLAYQFVEDFELTNFPPDCWRIHREEPDPNSIATWIRAGEMAMPGSMGYARSPNAPGTFINWLISKAIEVPATGAGYYALSFYDRFFWASDGGTFDIWVSTTDNDIASFELIHSVATMGRTQFWQENNIPLIDFAGETIYIAFRVVSSDGWWTAGWDIDDISLVLLPVEAISKYPAENSDNVRVDATIVVTFDQPITEGPNFNAISISPGVAGFTPSITGNVLSITQDGFAHETLYTVTIPAGAITDLANDIVWSFTTTTDAVLVLDRTPAVNAVDIAFNAPIVVTFNQDVTLLNPAGITFNPAVTGISADVFGGVLTITHDGFDWDTEYTITIATTAIDGLTEAIVWSFTTVIPPATIPFFENFASTDGPRNLPARWTVTEGPGGWHSGGGGSFVLPHRTLFITSADRQQGPYTWAFSGPIWLEEGVSHFIGFHYVAPGFFHPAIGQMQHDNFRVKIGSEPNAEAMLASGSLVYEKIGAPNVGNWERVRVIYTPSFTGIHHLGFQNLTQATNGQHVAIDAISIREAFDNDLEVSATEGWPTKTPISQPLTLSATVTNVGLTPQTNIVLSATQNGEAVSTSVPLATLAVDASAVMQLQDPLVAVLGQNTIVYTVTQAETDGYLGDNTLERTIIGTENVFARDLLTAPTATGLGINHGGTFATVFEVTQLTALSAVQLFFAERGDGVNTYMVGIFRMTGPLTTSTTPIADRTGQRVPGTVNIVDFSDEETIILEPGRYLVALSAQDFIDLSFDDSEIGGWYSVNFASGLMEFHTGSGAPGIRLVIDENIDIPLVLTSKTPADGSEDVALNADIRLTFNVGIQANDLGSITINPPLATATPRIVANQLVIDHEGLTESTLYVITIPAGTIVGYDEPIVWSFTTAFPSAAYQDPFNLIVAVDGQDARLTWIHGSEIEPIFSEGFNAVTFPPTGWTHVDQDGDGLPFWARTEGISIGGQPLPPFEGQGMAWSRSWITGPSGFHSDNWLITPNITLPNDPSLRLNFVIRSEGGGFLDHIEVLVSTTGRATGSAVGNVGVTVGDFTSIYRHAPPGGLWTEVSLPIANFAGQNVYIAFRHKETNNSWIALDDVSIIRTLPSDGSNFNIFLDGSLVATNVTEREHVFTNLDPGNRVASVQAVSETGLLSNIIPVLFTIEPPLYPGQVALTAPANNAQNVSVTPTLTWTAPTSGGAVVEYFVYLGETATNLVRVAELPGTETSFTVAPALPINATRYWRVIASNATGEGEPSAMWSFTTGDPTNIVGTLDATAVQLFPNPVTDGFFYVEAEEMRQIEIIDMLGRTVMQKNVNSSRERVDVSNLRDALYFVRVTTTTGTTLVRIVVQ